MSSGNRYAIITGCGEGGIGHALTKQFIGNGFTVIATLLPHENREHLKHPQIRVIDLDVTKEDQFPAFKKETESITNGRLDVLVNNAGICYTMTAADTDVKKVELMFAVNVFGPMRMVHHFHRWLIAAKGIVINIGSIGGVCPYVFGASYNATKAALHHYGNTLRVEMRPFDVRVMTVISGEVSTNILKNDVRDNRTLPAGSVYTPLNGAFNNHINRKPNTMSPDEYARGVVATALKKNPPAWFWHGNATTLIWTLSTFFPQTIYDWLFGRMFNLKVLHGTFDGY